VRGSFSRKTAACPARSFAVLLRPYPSCAYPIPASSLLTAPPSCKWLGLKWSIPAEVLTSIQIRALARCPTDIKPVRMPEKANYFHHMRRRELVKADWHATTQNDEPAELDSLLSMIQFVFNSAVFFRSRCFRITLNLSSRCNRCNRVRSCPSLQYLAV
jgi:hypothetical protein